MDAIDNAVCFDTFMLLNYRVRLFWIQSYDFFHYVANFRADNFLFFIILLYNTGAESKVQHWKIMTILTSRRNVVTAKSGVGPFYSSLRGI